VRKRELEHAGRILGLASVTVIDDAGLRDGMAENWESQLIQKYILMLVDEKQTTAILTFDKMGVSGHANHRSIHTALSTLSKSHNYQLFTLKTVSALRKYASILDIWPSLIQKDLLIASSPFPARHAMDAHVSQMVWFRRFGWCIFSRYIVINQLQLES